MTADPGKWNPFIESLPIRPLFVTVSGAHLYGFPSPDSDIDLRGCHLLPLTDLLGLRSPVETFEKDSLLDGIEIDIVSHDVGKYLRLMTRNNGYILEQVFSPLVVRGQAFLDQLRPLARQCITKNHYHHYRGFYAGQRKLLDKQHPKRVKQVLYAYRVLLTGIHLMRSGQVEANLLKLNETFRLGFIDELVASKITEKAAPDNLDWPFHANQLQHLENELALSFEQSDLPGQCELPAINDFLVQTRLLAATQAT